MRCSILSIVHNQFSFLVSAFYCLLFFVRHVCLRVLAPWQMQAAKETEAGPEDGEDVEDVEPHPVGSKASSQCSRMNEQFVMRKIERDRHSGRQFAPVCDEVKLSSSGSSSEDDDDADKKTPSGIPKSVSISSDELLDNLSVPMLTGLDDAAVIKSVEQKRKSPSPPEEEVIATKRRRRIISSSSSSSDSELEDGPSQLQQSPAIPNEEEDGSSELERQPSHREKSPTPSPKEDSSSELKNRSIHADKSPTFLEDSDSELNDGLSPAEKSPTPILNEDSDVEFRKSATSPVSAETSVPDIKPSINVLGMEDVQSRETVVDKEEDKPAPEAESGSEEINAETGEVCYREPDNDGR